jgi:hypothetical protein
MVTTSTETHPSMKNENIRPPRGVAFKILVVSMSQSSAVHSLPQDHFHLSIGQYPLAIPLAAW